MAFNILTDNFRVGKTKIKWRRFKFCNLYKHCSNKTDNPIKCLWLWYGFQRNQSFYNWIFYYLLFAIKIQIN